MSLSAWTDGCAQGLVTPTDTLNARSDPTTSSAVVAVYEPGLELVSWCSEGQWQLVTPVSGGMVKALWCHSGWLRTLTS